MTRTQFDWYYWSPKPNLLGYRHPETVLFPFDRPILCWHPLGHLLLLPQLKVLDFLDTECE